jgi:hypothetical protein
VADGAKAGALTEFEHLHKETRERLAVLESERVDRGEVPRLRRCRARPCAKRKRLRNRRRARAPSSSAAGRDGCRDAPPCPGSHPRSPTGPARAPTPT